MSITNWFFSELKALAQNKKVVVTAYTVKVGSTANNFQVDRVIDVGDPADDFTITVPDGEAIGQELTIVMSSNANSKTCSVSITHHETSDPEVLILNAADEYIKLIWTGTEWATIATTATTS